MALQQVIESTVTGLGYDLVEIERSAGGLLRVSIDWPWHPGQDAERSIGLEDCERVTRQLQYVLEVEGIDYRRLEVASPGIDRPLKSMQDFERFTGHVIDLVLKEPIGAAAAGAVSGLRKRFRGTLEREDGALWRIVWRDEPAAKPGQRARRPRQAPPLQAMSFSLGELREARLAPLVDFKGRAPSRASGPEAGVPPSAIDPQAGPHPHTPQAEAPTDGVPHRSDKQ